MACRPINCVHDVYYTVAINSVTGDVVDGKRNNGKIENLSLHTNKRYCIRRTNWIGKALNYIISLVSAAIRSNNSIKVNAQVHSHRKSELLSFGFRGFRVSLSLPHMKIIFLNVLH